MLTVSNSGFNSFYKLFLSLHTLIYLPPKKYRFQICVRLHLPIKTIILYYNYIPVYYFLITQTFNILTYHYKTYLIVIFIKQSKFPSDCSFFKCVIRIHWNSKLKNTYGLYKFMSLRFILITPNLGNLIAFSVFTPIITASVKSQVATIFSFATISLGLSQSMIININY